MKLTKMELRDSGMPKNEHGSSTYGEWCKKEVKRIGAGASYFEEFRISTKDGVEVVPEGTEKAKAWCRVDRV